MAVVAVTLEPSQTLVENTLYGSQDPYHPQAAIPPGVRCSERKPWRCWVSFSWLGADPAFCCWTPRQPARLDLSKRAWSCLYNQHPTLPVCCLVLEVFHAPRHEASRRGSDGSSLTQATVNRVPTGVPWRGGRIYFVFCIYANRFWDLSEWPSPAPLCEVHPEFAPRWALAPRRQKHRKAAVTKLCKRPRAGWQRDGGGNPTPVLASADSALACPALGPSLISLCGMHSCGREIAVTVR